MKDLKATCLRYVGSKLYVLNQQKLSQTEEWLLCQSPAQMHEIIHTLQVRGAPAIAMWFVLLRRYLMKM